MCTLCAFDVPEVGEFLEGYTLVHLATPYRRPLYIKLA
jgi:hypothetical protein